MSGYVTIILYFINNLQYYKDDCSQIQRIKDASLKWHRPRNLYRAIELCFFLMTQSRYLAMLQSSNPYSKSVNRSIKSNLQDWMPKKLSHCAIINGRHVCLCCNTSYWFVSQLATNLSSISKNPSTHAFCQSSKSLLRSPKSLETELRKILAQNSVDYNYLQVQVHRYHLGPIPKVCQNVPRQESKNFLANVHYRFDPTVLLR